MSETTPKINVKTLPQTERCFLDERLEDKAEYTSASMLWGERFSLQVGIQLDRPQHDRTIVFMSVESEISEYISLRRVDNVPVRMPLNPGADDGYYLRTEPGLFPDLLRPMSEKTRIPVMHWLAAIWVDIRIPASSKISGEFPIRFMFKDFDGNILAETTFTVNVIAAELPEQKIAVTQWFHADCLAAYYGLEIFSEEHWAVIKNFIETAVDNGINMILTPIFTPPLDTAVGGERPTVQLVDVYRKHGKWSFGFEKLERWVNMCLDCGVKYFEFSHLFTQWGAHHAPKVMAETENGYERVFGWDTDAGGEDYRGFLTEMLPRLIAETERLGVADRCVFHISDEPGGDMLESYLAAKNVVKDQLHGQMIMDALSDFSFYEKGVVEHPAVSEDHVKPYLEAGVPDLWVYYCCCQSEKVSNRFLSMPGARNRIIGQMFYKYKIAGFLQWGYNFWFTQESCEFCDPYLCTDGGMWVPAGDAFSVYPAPGGSAYETLHLRGFTAALDDLRAFTLCEELCGRDAVMAVIEERGSVAFDEYPHGDEQVLSVREKINSMIAEKIGK